MRLLVLDDCDRSNIALVLGDYPGNLVQDAGDVCRDDNQSYLVRCDPGWMEFHVDYDLAEAFVDRIAEIITRYNMAPPGSRIGVAVSAGADSVVLLQLLHRLTDRSAVHLHVLHVNHQLRGAESDADEAFVQALAESLGLRCSAERAQLAPGNLEQAAREARRRFFFRIRDELELSKIALGHTRSDQAETLLFRFLRGTGTTGLAGMRFATADGLIRPLLAVGRREVRAWAAAEGIGWREDSSNQDVRFARNRLRHETIPGLERDFNPNLEGVLANTAGVAQTEEDYWDLEISTRYGQIIKRTQLGLFLQISELTSLHVAVQRRLIRRAIFDLRGSLRSIDAQHIDSILGICHSSEGHDRVLAPGVDALRSFGTLLLTEPGKLTDQKRHYRLELIPGEERELPYNAGSIFLHTESCANLNDSPEKSTEIADLRAGSCRLFARNWEPGDEIQLTDYRSARKLKALFQEQKVLLWERRHWPVVICGEEIVWVRRFGCSAKYKGPVNGLGGLRLIYRQALK